MNKVTTVLLGIVFLAASLVLVQQTPSAAQPLEVGNKICPVSGDHVAGGKMGSKPVTFEYKGKIYHLCCPMCIKDFKKHPEKYSKIAEDEVK
jgi:YHS domain-containing protein